MSDKPINNYSLQNPELENLQELAVEQPIMPPAAIRITTPTPINSGTSTPMEIPEGTALTSQNLAEAFARQGFEITS